MEEKKFEFTESELRDYMFSCYMTGSATSVMFFGNKSYKSYEFDFIANHANFYINSMVNLKKKLDTLALC